MESEKVKEIKKALECCTQNEIEDTCEYCSNCPASDWDYEKECNVELFQKTITLISELESENAKQLEENESLNGSWKMQIKKIAELEKKNKDYYDRLNNLQTYIDNHEEIWKGNTNNALNKFAESLKEKVKNFCGTEYENAYYDVTKSFACNDIDETLKEFLGGQND